GGGEGGGGGGGGVVVAAPLGGILKAPEGGAPRAGQAVKKGQVLFQFLPLLTPEARTTIATSRVDAEGQVKSAETTLDAARIALERARGLFQSQAGSRKEVDAAQATFGL